MVFSMDSVKYKPPSVAYITEEEKQEILYNAKYGISNKGKLTQIAERIKLPVPPPEGVVYRLDIKTWQLIVMDVRKNDK